MLVPYLVVKFGYRVCGGVCFFFNDTATTEIYTLSLHDALPIFPGSSRGTEVVCVAARCQRVLLGGCSGVAPLLLLADLGGPHLVRAISDPIMGISIFGLGYVGTTCAGCFVSQGHTVVGVDVNPSKVDGMNAGVSPIVESKLPELFAEGHETRRLSATTSAADAIQATSVSLVCVGTPSQANGNLDLSYMKRVCEEMGTALGHKHFPHHAVARTTMLPGGPAN